MSMSLLYLVGMIFSTERLQGSVELLAGTSQWKFRWGGAPRCAVVLLLDLRARSWLVLGSDQRLGGPSEAVSARAGQGWLSGYNWIQGLPERERERERERGREREGKSEMLKSATFWWEDKNTIILERICLSFVCLMLVWCCVLLTAQYLQSSQDIIPPDQPGSAGEARSARTGKLGKGKAWRNTGGLSGRGLILT